MSLGPATQSGNVFSFAVTLDFTADPGFGVVFFGLDVSDSSAALKGGTPPFSAFSFTPAPTLPAGWGENIPFGNPTIPFYVEYDTPTGINPLAPGTHVLGTLAVDLDKAGVTANLGLFVSIADALTSVGGEDPNDPSTFDIFTPRFVNGSQSLVSPAQTAVPEPTSLTLFAAAGLVVICARMRRQR